MLSLFKFRVYYSPDDVAGTGLPKGDDVQDILNFLNADETDDEKPEVIKLDKAKADEKLDDADNEKDEEEDEEGKEKEEVDELAELEEELKEPDEEQLELVTPVRRSEILKKFPTIFKEFPYLEKAYYREQQFTERFPTMKDADDAVASTKTLQAFESDLLAGNTEKMLRAAKTEPKSFAKVVDNYMSTLATVDKDAYHHVLGNVISHTIASMVQEARKSNNEALQNAAAILNQFIFATSDYVPPKQLAVPDDDKNDPRAKDLEEREKKFESDRFNATSSELMTKVQNSFKSTIDAHIDPKDSMGEYVKRNAVRDASEKLEELIKKDSRFKTIVDKLWDKARKENYSKPTVDAVKSAYLSKARTLLPAVIKQARNTALKGSGKRIVNVTDKTDKTDKNTDRSQSNRSRDNKKTVPDGMSTLDFLNAD